MSRREKEPKDVSLRRRLYSRVRGSGFRVKGSGFRVQGSGLRVQGSGFRVQGFGLGCRHTPHGLCAAADTQGQGAASLFAYGGFELP